MKLFEDDFGEDNSPIEDINITTTLLYFSEQQLAEFKRLAKAGIKQMFGEEFQQKGNLPIFLLTLMREKYGTTNEVQETSEASAGR